MRRLFVMGLLAAVAAVVTTAGRSAAQPPGKLVGPVANPPRFSSYLNLVPSNGNAAVNYYGIVKPQQHFANQVLALQQSQASPFTPAGAVGPDQPVTTGTQFGFQNYRLYFQNQFTAGGTAGGIGPNFGPWKK